MMKEIIEDLSKYKGILCSWIGRLKIVKMSVLIYYDLPGYGFLWVYPVLDSSNLYVYIFTYICDILRPLFLQIFLAPHSFLNCL